MPLRPQKAPVLRRRSATRAEGLETATHCGGRCPAAAAPASSARPRTTNGAKAAAWLDCAKIAESDLHRPPTPALTVEHRKLTLAVCERMPFAPAAGRAQHELPVGPPQRAPAAKTPRLKLAHSDAKDISRLYAPSPESRATDSPPHT